MFKYELLKEDSLSGRYITNSHIEPLIGQLHPSVKVDKVGNSVKKKPIYTLTFGSGQKRILAWSQMHGNESTTTKALFDVLNILKLEDGSLASVLKSCTICIIPILNPDGAENYTRLNSNDVDLNRDAQTLSQPESVVLRKVFEDFKPDYCFNLHGQRTIFSAGYSCNSSVMSFLSPAENPQRAVTQNRKMAMEVILAMNIVLNTQIPNQVSRYDDGYNSNCVGDAFMSIGVPTVLFEAGHFPGDYMREITRKHVFVALTSAFEAIASNDYSGDNYQEYFKLPENQKLFYDVIIRDVVDGLGNVLDVALQYEEILVKKMIEFRPKVIRVGDLSEFFGHKEIDGSNNAILINNSSMIKESLSIINSISIDGVDFAKKIAVK